MLNTLTSHFIAPNPRIIDHAKLKTRALVI